MKCAKCGYEIYPEQTHCTQCGTPTGEKETDTPAVTPAVENPGTSAGIQAVGLFLIVIGALGALFYMFGFDPSVEAAGLGSTGRINNNGLLVQQQNGVLVSCTVGIIGAIFFTSGKR